jgi:hypothetical protein
MMMSIKWSKVWKVDFLTLSICEITILVYVWTFLCVLLEFELRVLYSLSRSSTTWVQNPIHLDLVIFEIESHLRPRQARTTVFLLILLAWLGWQSHASKTSFTVTLAIFAFWVGSIIGMNHCIWPKIFKLYIKWLCTANIIPHIYALKICLGYKIYYNYNVHIVNIPILCMIVRLIRWRNYNPT